jgi:hypothetical protein
MEGFARPADAAAGFGFSAMTGEKATSHERHAADQRHKRTRIEPRRTTHGARHGNARWKLRRERELACRTVTCPRQREWPVSDRARWLPALAMAIGIIYGGDEGDGRSSGGSGTGSPRR